MCPVCICLSRVPTLAHATADNDPDAAAREFAATNRNKSVKPVAFEQSFTAAATHIWFTRHYDNMNRAPYVSKLKAEERPTGEQVLSPKSDVARFLFRLMKESGTSGAT